MPSAPSKIYADDVSLLVVTLDTNPFFWATFPFPFAEFLSQVLAFLNSILLLGQLNQVIVIATGCNSCAYVYDSSSERNHGATTGTMPALYSNLLHNINEFLARDRQLDALRKPGTVPSSLLSGSLSMALCCILIADSVSKFFRFTLMNLKTPYVANRLYLLFVLPDWIVRYTESFSLRTYASAASGASAISEQLTWASYVLCACPFSVSIMISVQPVGKCLFPQLSLCPSVSIQFIRMLWIKWV
ncbi:hypothetical protein V8G54_006056 [Vigna mungo]|uniref:General transcription and DNA repair factor IIH subunit TFB4 n=1 Tax=Vigna mungo TaxID=3915 RepID=A0AAQ3NZ70_VIGMU